MLSCKRACVLNNLIVETKYEIPFYTRQNESLKESGKIENDKFERINVNESEIPYIMEILNEQIPHISNATDRIKNNLCNYSVLIAGIYNRSTKTKSIYLNFSYGPEGYETEGEVGVDYLGNAKVFPIARDGGDSYFQAVINTKTNKLRIIYINGEA